MVGCLSPRRRATGVGTRCEIGYGGWRLNVHQLSQHVERSKRGGNVGLDRQEGWCRHRLTMVLMQNAPHRTVGLKGALQGEQIVAQ